jgi:hypothetical protein
MGLETDFIVLSVHPQSQKLPFHGNDNNNEYPSLPMPFLTLLMTGRENG